MPCSAYRQHVKAYLSPDLHAQACRYFATRTRGETNGILEAALSAYITGTDAKSVQDRTLARLARALARIDTNEQRRIEFAGRFAQLCASQVPPITSEEALALARRKRARGMETYRRAQQALSDRGQRFVDELHIAPVATAGNDPPAAETVPQGAQAGAELGPSRASHDAGHPQRARVTHRTAERPKRKRFEFWMRPEPRKALETYAASQGVSESAVVEGALRSHLEALDPERLVRSLARLGASVERIERAQRLADEITGTHFGLWLMHAPSFEEHALVHASSNPLVQRVMRTVAALAVQSGAFKRVEQEGKA